ncbi:MAG: class I SAM-dependent methyltransferase, partial [Anaerolineales bacterium]
MQSINVGQDDSALLELLREEEFRYQSIPLAQGVKTSGGDRAGTLAVIMPSELSGKSVLDVGCHYGFFSFEAAKRGARRVMGVDFDDDALRKAGKLREVIGSDVEFRKLNIANQTVDEKFDIVLCLNVLHHLPDPLRTLNDLVDITRERLVLEVAGVRGRDAKKMFQRNAPATWSLHPLPLLQPILDRLPQIMLGSADRLFESNFFFSRVALERLLVHQKSLFWKVKTVNSPFKGRFICIADKLRIDDLLIVAGPSASGKSRFIRNLAQGGQPEVDRIMENCDAPWVEGRPNHIGDLPRAHLPKLAYHYDFMRPFLRGPFNFERDRATDVFSVAEAVTSVTLVTEAKELADRWDRREIRAKTHFGMYLGPKRAKKIARTFGDKASVAALYDRWVEFISRQPGDHYLLDT